MALAERSALAHTAAAGRHGRIDGDAGVTLALVDDLMLWLMIARRDQGDSIRRQAEILGTPLPDGPHATVGEPFDVLWAGPDQWLVAAPRRDAHAAKRFLGGFSQSCTIVEQSDGRAVVEIAGPRARDCLAKLCGVDLHPRAFRPNDVALTPISGVASLLWQTDDTPRYRLAMPRSYAESLWHGLVDAAAEYGVTVVA